MTPSTYCRNITAHAQATMYYSGTTGAKLIVYEGKEYTLEEFNAAFDIRPLEVKQADKYGNKENPDKTRLWIRS